MSNIPSPYIILSVPSVSIRSEYALAIGASVVAAAHFSDILQISHMFFLVLALLVIATLYESSTTTQTSTSNRLETHLALVDPDGAFPSLVEDANVIEFLYDVGLVFKPASSVIYTELVSSMNDFLEKVGDCKTGVLKNPISTIEFAEESGKAAMNAMHSFVHTIDIGGGGDPYIRQEYNDDIDRLKTLIISNLDAARSVYSKERLYGGGPDGVLTHANNPVFLDLTNDEEVFNTSITAFM